MTASKGHCQTECILTHILLFIISCWFLIYLFPWFLFLLQAFPQCCLNLELVALMRLSLKRRSVSFGASTPCLSWHSLQWPCHAGCTSCSPNRGTSSASAGTTCLNLVRHLIVVISQNYSLKWENRNCGRAGTFRDKLGHTVCLSPLYVLFLLLVTHSALDDCHLYLDSTWGLILIWDAKIEQV